MGFPRHEYWSELPLLPLAGVGGGVGSLPGRGIEPGSLMSPALAGGLFTTSATWLASNV